MTTIGIGQFALIRRPLLPLATFANWSASADTERFVLDQYLDPLLEEGLYIASPALHARLLQLRGEGPALHATERRATLVSLGKFLSRAAYRCTPFGLFAHVQYARLASGVPALPGRSLRRGIHLDAGVETRLVEAALKDHDWRATLSWQISSTAHVVGNHLSYVDWIYQDNGQRKYRGVELGMNEGLALLRERCGSPQPFEQLCAWLVEDIDVSPFDARAFLHETIDCRLLLPRLAPTAASGCTLDQLLSACTPHPATATLRAIQEQLHTMRARAADTGSLVPLYQDLHKAVEAQVDVAHLKHGVIQVDTIDDSAASMDPDIARRVVEAASLLAQHTARRRGSLDDYKRLFRDRFEDREVNLAYALHAELGVPFPARAALDSPLLDGLKLAPDTPPEPGAPLLNAFDKLLVERLFDHAARGQSTLSISAEDLARLPVPGTSAQLAEGLYAHVSVLPSPPGTAPLIELHGIDGRNGLEMLARFCHLSEELGAAARDYAGQGARNGDAIYAEIIHHPQDRLLNILRRPRLASHEIVYAGASELPRAQQLWLEDLTVQLVGERFVLRDRHSGRQVIARLTSAHNYSARQLGAYQFLCHLQDDDASWMGFHWPHALRDLPRLPRVEVAGLVVARAQWMLHKDDIDAFNQALVTATLDDWRGARGLPRFVTWDQGDNRLPIDLHNPASAMLLLDEIIKLPAARLHECLALNAAGEHGCYEQHNQEWVLPLQLSQPTAAAGAPPSNRLHVEREGQVCAALDEWAYLRIYTGSGHADRVLRDVVMPAMHAAMESGDIERWFFIRYQDRFEHLRLRFFSRRHERLLATMAQLHAALDQARADGLLWRVVGDHYAPEWDRYGGPAAMSLCEQLFCIDSQDMHVLLDIEDGEAPQRWLYALASLDAYAQQLCPDHAERERMLDAVARDFLNEHAPGAARSQALVALGARFRDMRKEVESLRHASGPLAHWQAHLRTSAARRAAPIAALRAHLEPLGEARLDSVVHSLLHMHCNRLAPSEPRRHEVVLYDFARRLERARQAQRRAAGVAA